MEGGGCGLIKVQFWHMLLTTEKNHKNLGKGSVMVGICTRNVPDNSIIHSECLIQRKFRFSPLCHHQNQSPVDA